MSWPGRWRILWAVLTAALSCLLTDTLLADQPEAKTIAWRLRQDEQLRIRMTHRMQTEMQFGEKLTTVAMLSAMELHWHVIRVDASGLMAIDQTIRRLVLQTTEADGKTWSYDSTVADQVPPALREVAQTLRPLLNSRVTVAFSPRGEIQDVQIAAETESLLRDIPEFARWKNLLTREGISRMLHQALGRLPDQPVVAGDVWQVIRELETPAGKVSLTDRFEYRGTAVEAGHRLEWIHRTTTIQRGEPVVGAFDDPPPQRQPQDTGTLHFDNDTGRLVRSHNRHQWKLETPSEEGNLVVSSTATLDTRIDPADAP